jgi:hypothetical protein
MTQQKNAMACQTIPQVASWKTATMMKHYARPLRGILRTWPISAIPEGLIWRRLPGRRADAH